MKISNTLKENIISVVSYLYILLFVYAATSKILDFENFQVQLGQSPLLSAFAGYVAVGVPLIELLISFMLLVPKYRMAGLFASFGLMIMFTTYIYIILNYSSFVPCSCGGVLEKLSWTHHLIFNVVFIGFSAIALLLYQIKHKI